MLWPVTMLLAFSVGRLLALRAHKKSASTSRHCSLDSILADSGYEVELDDWYRIARWKVQSRFRLNPWPPKSTLHLNTSRSSPEVGYV